MKIFIIQFLFYNLIVTYCLSGQPLSSESWLILPECSDDFNDVILNTNKWTTWDNGFNDCAMGTKFYPENVKPGQFSSDGSGNKVLQIITKRLPAPVTCMYGSPVSFSTGILNLLNPATSSHNQLKYGYYEIQSKLPSGGRNVAGSFWLWNQKCPTDTPSDDRYTEIDIFELNSCLPHWYSHSVHDGLFTCTNPLASEYAYNYINVDNPDGNTILDFSTSFHTFGLDWQPNYIDFYIDGILYSHVTSLDRNSGLSEPQKTLYPDLTWPVSDLRIPMFLVINGGYSTTNIPTQYLAASYYPLASGNIFEVDYFHYYKRKPTITNAVYNSTSNSITLTVSTNNPGDQYNWTHGPYININGPTNTNVANILLSSAYNGTWVDVSAAGTYPSASTNTIFTFQQISGNLCSIPAQSRVYVANSINAPQSGCSTVLVASGTNVTFVAQNEITLNSGFEVQLGGTFLGVTK